MCFMWFARGINMSCDFSCTMTGKVGDKCIKWIRVIIANYIHTIRHFQQFYTLKLNGKKIGFINVYG